jgi:hypothetical protein
MRSNVTLFRKFPRSGWKKAVGLAALPIAFLVACDPPTPNWGECEDVPPCSAYNYHVDIHAIAIDTVTGAYDLDHPGLRAYFGPDWTVPALTRRAASQHGSASATSCVPCTGTITVDSAYFTTDLVTWAGDTLKAGGNLVARTLPAQIHLSATGGSLRIDSLATPVSVRYGDSLFEVRFSGTIDGIRKSASAKFHVTNPDLLFP